MVYCINVPLFVYLVGESFETFNMQCKLGVFPDFSTYCTFQKHTVTMKYVLLLSIKPWKTETNKMDGNIPITTDKRDLLTWLK